jgi:hypothetical protein
MALQSAETFLPDALWSDLPDPVSNLDGHNTVVAPIGSKTLFYRLRSQVSPRF